MEFEVLDLEGFLEILVVGERAVEADLGPSPRTEPDSQSPAPATRTVDIDSIHLSAVPAPLIVGRPDPTPTEADLPPVPSSTTEVEAIPDRTDSPPPRPTHAYHPSLDGLILPTDRGLEVQVPWP